MAEERHFPMTGNHVKYITGDVMSFSTDAAASYLEPELTTLRLGVENKTLDTEEMFLCWDTTIPAGAIINAATITTTAGAVANTVAPLTMGIIPLAQGNWSSQSEVVTQRRARLRISLFGDGSGSAATTNTEGLKFAVSPAANFDSLAQVVTASGTGDLEYLRVYVWRDDLYGSNTADDGIVWWEVWSVTGSAGSYREDSLLASSDNILYDDLRDEVSAYTTDWTFSSGYNAVSLTEGVSYAIKLRTHGLDGNQAISFLYQAEATEKDDNMIFFGDFDGFSQQTYPDRASIVEDDGPALFGGYPWGVDYIEHRLVNGTIALQVQNMGWGALEPTYTPAEDDPTTDLATGITLVGSSYDVTLEIETPPYEAMPGDWAYILYGDENWVTDGNFSTENLHAKWHKITEITASSILISHPIPWTFSGSSKTLTTPQPGTFYLHRGSGGTGVAGYAGTYAGSEWDRDLLETVHVAVRSEGYTGRIGFHFSVRVPATAADANRVYWSEDRFLQNGDYHGPRLWVNYTPAAATGISVEAASRVLAAIDAVAILGPRLDAALGLSCGGLLDTSSAVGPSIEGSAMLSASVRTKIGIN